MGSRDGANRKVVEGMKHEKQRLASFGTDWPATTVTPSQLAEVGLFYLGIEDYVQCAFCHGIISGWEEDANPLEEHVRNFPMCPFLLMCDVGNVSITGETRSRLLPWVIRDSKPERQHSPPPKHRVLECLICTVRSVDKAFLPCGHTACSQCTASLSSCPNCMAKLDGSITLHL